MPIRSNGGVFNSQMLTGSLNHYVVCGADFSGAIDVYGRPVPGSAAEIIFVIIESSANVEIMNPTFCNLSFALQAGRSTWDEISLTAMIRGLGANVGVDHVNCTLCTVKQVPYTWGCGDGTQSFIDLVDTPLTYAGSSGYVVTVNSAANGLIFTPPGGVVSTAFSTIAVPTQPSITAVGADTLTFIAGNNVSIATNPTLKTVTINSTSVASSDYTPIPPGTLLEISSRYFVTSPGTVTLPSGAGISAGKSIIIAKKPLEKIFVVVGNIADTIATDLGTTDTLEFDATQEIILVFDGTATWNLQIGSYNL
jgi:hypothetical protein